MLTHTLFDIAAAACSLALTVWVYHWRLQDEGPHAIEEHGTGYAIALLGGAVLGGFGFGTLNLWLSDVPGLGRSILGALAGAIAAVEVFKRSKKVRGSTGLLFVAGFSASVAVGRWGCFFSGIDDQTYGIPSDLPWARDFGDGILRHPVQAYEALSMAAFLTFALLCFAQRQPAFMRNGFYLMVGFYGAQRFVWEFFKPYSAIVGPLNLFHFLCLALIAYCAVMIKRNAHDRTAA